ncbi:hypothetical protein FLGE108171_16105 [Flavobacterium gelidilacus]
MPVVVTISITVSTELTPLIVTGTVTVPASSFTDTLPIVTVGAPSLSIIVTVPLVVVLLVLPDVTVPPTVKVSSSSSIASSNIGITTSTVVCPAGIVTVMIVVV